MKLSQLFPIQNCVINGYSLIENVFGTSFVVYDAMGAMLTTRNNFKLFRHAQTLLEKVQEYDTQGLAHALAQLREEADRLVQADYERSVRREWKISAFDDNDYSAMAGSLG